MTPATMRWLDRRCGLWLCRLLARLPRRRAAAPAPRLLCIGLAEMGSIVLAAPALRRLGARGVEVYFLTFAAQRDVPALAGITETDRVRVLRNESLLRLGIDIVRFVVWARRMNFAAAIDLDPCMYFSAALAGASGARDRVGFVHEGARWRARNALYTRPLPYAEGRHMADAFAAMVDLLPACEAGARTHLALRSAPSPAPATKSATLALRIAQHFPDLDPARHRIVFLNPNAGDAIPQRRWPERRFVELAQRLVTACPDIRIALIGSGADHAACAAIAAQLAAQRCANLAGLCAVEELPTLFSLGRLLVSNDSGPAHLASLTALPTIVLFGPETPALYRPLGNAIPIYAAMPCSPCITPQNQRASSCRDNRCMQAIPVERVYTLAMEMLSAPAEQRSPAAREVAA